MSAGGGLPHRDRFLLLSLTGLTGGPVRLVARPIVGVVVLLTVLRGLGPPVSSALTVFVALLLMATPGEPWYELVRVVLVVLTGCWQWLGVVVAYLTALLGGPHVAASQSPYLAALIPGVEITALRRLARRLGGDPAAILPVADRGPS